MDPEGFDTGTGCFDTDETRVFARLAEAGHPVPPCLLTYPSDATVPQTPGRSFTERVSVMIFFLYIHKSALPSKYPCVVVFIPFEMHFYFLRG